MATVTSSLTLLFTTFFLLRHHHVSLAADCSNHTCQDGGPTIRFPFYLISDIIPDTHRHNRLFGLTCQNRTQQAVFNFPDSGEFVVAEIDYIDRKVRLRDPDDCLARRLQNPISLSGTNLSCEYYEEFKFLNCSLDLIWGVASPFQKVGCLSGETYSVFVTSGDFPVESLEYKRYGCFDSWTEMVPTPWVGDRGGGLFPATFWLSWGGGFGCDKPHHTHHVNLDFLHAKVALILITAIPWLSCILCALWRHKIRTSASPPDQSQPATQLTETVVMDMSAIELAFPKTRVGDKLARIEDNNTCCSICLCEYRDKEMVRTITQCNHYFHANCVDEWLKKNPTCPLCRNYQVPLTKLPVAAATDEGQ